MLASSRPEGLVLGLAVMRLLNPRASARPPVKG
jgi:hypothetical protein